MSKLRIRAVFSFFLVIILLLVIHLFNISQIKQVSFTKSASDQRRKTEIIKNYRGCIYDCSMIPLVDRTTDSGTFGQNLSVSKSPRYGKSNMASHVIGYTLSDGTGVTGIEKAFDKILSCDESEKITYMVDAKGNAIGEKILSKTNDNYIPPENVKLTLDYKIQKITEDVSDRLIPNGAAVVLDVSTFDVLAMVSRPSFTQSDITQSLNKSNSPLMNKALCSYNAGSIFKIITSCAMLEKGRENFSNTCKGALSIDGKDFLCNNKNGHGKLNFSSGFALSCNCFFYEGSKGLGKEIENLCVKFGMGQKLLNCDIGETGGFVPMRNYYFPKEEANIAIGQGEILITPLQAANLACIIASGGVKKSINLADSIVDKYGAVKKNLRVSKEERIIKEETAQSLRKMMREVVTTGTGKGALSKKVSICGKTGSAETGWEKDGQTMVHGWFCGFFPEDNPKYAMAVFSQDGKSGAVSCIPAFLEIAERIMEY